MGYNTLCILNSVTWENVERTFARCRGHTYQICQSCNSMSHKIEDQKSIISGNQETCENRKITYLQIDYINAQTVTFLATVISPRYHPHECPYMLKNKIRLINKKSKYDSRAIAYPGMFLYPQKDTAGSGTDGRGRDFYNSQRFGLSYKGVHVTRCRVQRKFCKPNIRGSNGKCNILCNLAPQ